MPAKRKTAPFPGVDKLPGVVRAAVETVFPPDDLGISPVPMIAVGGPGNIPALKAAGKSGIERLRRSGMNKDLFEVLEFAQQKYPRLFGHIQGVNQDAPTPLVDKIMDFLGLPPVRSGFQTSSFPKGTSVLHLNPTMTGREAVKAVGHELTHVAQQARFPKHFGKSYDSLLDTFGYRNNPFERTATATEKSFAKKFTRRRFK